MREVKVEQPVVIKNDVLDKRDLYLQPGFLDYAHRLAELQHDCLLGLTDHIERMAKTKRMTTNTPAKAILTLSFM